MLEDAASSLLRVVQEDEGASTALFEMGAMPKLVELVESVNEELQARHLPWLSSGIGSGSGSGSGWRASTRSCRRPTPGRATHHGYAPWLHLEPQPHWYWPHPSAQVRVAGLLASCCAQVAAAREALHGLGAARKLLPLLSSGNEEVQEGGAMAVQQLSLLPAAAREVRLHGGVPLLVELMASLDARVQVL